VDDIAHLTRALSGRYAISREIGRGGMAAVYLARDLRHERNVALKVLNSEIGAVLGSERFLAEIKVTATLQHPNLLPLFDSGQADGLLYYVMPFVEGESLRARLEREKQIPVDEAVHIATAIADALDYAHRQGVVHRDLKPENILLHERQPLVADFGIALAVSNAGGARITQTGISLGTPQYMSPEQATGDRAIDGRTDLYSLGAVLYEMLTGDPPHLGSTAQAIIAKVLTDRPTSVRVTRPAVPGHVSAAIDRSLQKLPADRFATAHDMSEALRGRGTSSAPIATDVPTRVEAGRRWLGVGFVSSLAALLTIASALAVWGWLRAPSSTGATPAHFTVSLPPEISVDNVYAPLTISPDGQSIIFRANVGGTVQLARRRIDQLDVRPIPSTDGAGWPVVSPDNKWVAFIGNDQVRKVGMDGGPSVLISETHGHRSGFDWAPDGRIVIGDDRLVGGLHVIPALGGQLTPLTRVDSAHDEMYHRWPRVLADGNTVIYVDWPREGIAGAKLAMTTLDGSESRLLGVLGAFPVGVVEGHLVYVTADGVLMAVPFDVKTRTTTGTPIALIEGIDVNSDVGAARIALARSGTLVYLASAATSRLVTVDTSGTLRVLRKQAGQFTRPVWSPDGRSIVVEQRTARGPDIWMFEIASGSLTPLSDDGQSASPVWTPDGKHVLFIHRRSEIWWRAADGSSPAERKLNTGKDIREITVAPDGHTVVYRAGVDNDLLSVDLSGDGKSTPIVSSRFAQIHPALSPNGKWLAYASDEGGSFQVFARPFPGPGAVTPISVDGGLEPVWSSDGKRLYYRHGQQVMEATIVANATNGALSVADRHKLFEGPFTATGLPFQPSSSMSPDGKQFVMLERLEDESRLVVITNWLVELRAKLSAKR
jgi:serine/threonine protein kinase/Tol biopolymer transport system component